MTCTSTKQGCGKQFDHSRGAKPMKFKTVADSESKIMQWKMFKKFENIDIRAANLKTSKIVFFRYFLA